MTGATQALRVAGLADLPGPHEVLLDGVQLHVDNATVYSNVRQLNPTFARHLETDIYTARDCGLAAVSLTRLAPGAILHGGGEFLLTTQGVLLREQIAPYLAREPSRIADILATGRPRVQIDFECFLASRFGIYTWGHWLGEILPKLVLVETRYPGRFRYVVPRPVLADATPDRPWIRVRESLLGYGIDSTRLVLIDAEADYCFRQLFAVGSVWSDHLMHPAAAALMRDALIPAMMPPANAAANVALVREGHGRAIANAQAVTTLLRQQGFRFHPVGRMPFWDQVQLFRAAGTVFAILGSDLTGLIYARQGINVVTVAPSIFGDRFFYALVLDRSGRYADIRGPVAALDAEGHRSSFVIDPDEVRTALAMVRQASTAA